MLSLGEHVDRDGFDQGEGQAGEGFRCRTAEVDEVADDGVRVAGDKDDAVDAGRRADCLDDIGMDTATGRVQDNDNRDTLGDRIDDFSNDGFDLGALELDIFDFVQFGV